MNEYWLEEARKDLLFLIDEMEKHWKKYYNEEGDKQYLRGLISGSADCVHLFQEEIISPETTLENILSYKINDDITNDFINGHNDSVNFIYREFLGKLSETEMA
jgi:hypothetical protein